MKLLVINADDFGFTGDVNAGILDAHCRGVLTATTLMAYGAAFDDAVQLAARHPALDVGVHLTLVGAPRYPDSVTDLLIALARKQMRIYDELRAQIERVIAAGIQPSHLDTHKHTHLLPPVLTEVARLSREFGIRWVRRPFDFPLRARGVPFSRRALNCWMGFLRGRFHRVLEAQGCRTTDHFAGFQVTGHYDGAELASLIRSLPDGSTEFMCHPGFCTNELRGARTRLRESRRRELDALTSDEVRTALRETGVRVVSYRDLDCIVSAP
ncbi:MAG TPA: ChbG/HpnK family deacetylase [Bryobacteraceae bacterium]|nr:ChbG/HpnK family deacetylase [Bryobacteraceae bacterium]